MPDNIGRGVLIALTCASAAIAAACASIAPLHANLAGTRWAAASINGQPAGPRRPTLAFENRTRINGTAGCNSYFATYAANEGALVVSDVGRTEMACEGPIMAQEDAFLGALDNSSRYVVESNGRLVLSGAGGANLVFTRVT